jgi:hypothetical protein
LKKEQRVIYIELASEIDSNVCIFCRYEQAEGSPCDEDSYVTCEHPLEAVSDGECFPKKEDDCWGFSPCLNVRDAADIVGFILANNYERGKFQWWKEENGQIIIARIAKQTKEKLVGDAKVTGLGEFAE